METVVQALSQETVYEWVERIKNGRQDVSDEHQFGRPVCLATEAVKQKIELRISNYRRVTADEINLSHGPVYNIVHDDLVSCHNAMEKKHLLHENDSLNAPDKSSAMHACDH